MLIQFLITLLLFLKVDRMKIILEVLEPLERNMTKDCFSPLGKVFVNIKKPFSKTILQQEGQNILSFTRKHVTKG